MIKFESSDTHHCLYCNNRLTTITYGKLETDKIRFCMHCISNESLRKIYDFIKHEDTGDVKGE